MTAPRVPEDYAERHAVEFLVTLKEGWGGSSEPPVRREDLDQSIQGVAFKGFAFTNRGTSHELAVQDLDQPMTDEAIVILDGEQMQWADAITRVRATPSR